MKWKKAFIFALVIDFIIAGIFVFLVIKTDRGMEGLRKDNYDLRIQVQATQKQIPLLTKYWILVKELSDVSDGKLSAFEVTEIGRIIITQCQMNQDIDLTPALIMGIMERESEFNPKAISRKKAYGLMQAIRGTFELHLRGLGYGGFTKTLALDPIVNVQVGIKELVRLKRYWLEYDIDSWLIATNSYFWGTAIVWELFMEKKRAKLPSLEYAKGILDLEKKWREKGL